MFALTQSSGRGRRFVHLMMLSLLAAGVVASMRDAGGAFLFVIYEPDAIGGLLLLTLIRRLNRVPDDGAADSVSARWPEHGRHQLQPDPRDSGVGGLALVAVARRDGDSRSHSSASRSRWVLSVGSAEPGARQIPTPSRRPVAIRALKYAA